MKQDNVIVLPVVTTLDLDPDRILQNAMGKLESVIIIGYVKNPDVGSRGPGAEDEFFASSIADGGDALWLMQRYCLKLLQTADEPE